MRQRPRLCDWLHRQCGWLMEFCRLTKRCPATSMSSSHGVHHLIEPQLEPRQSAHVRAVHMCGQCTCAGSAHVHLLLHVRRAALDAVPLRPLLFGSGLGIHQDGIASRCKLVGLARAMFPESVSQQMMASTALGIDRDDLGRYREWTRCAVPSPRPLDRRDNRRARWRERPSSIPRGVQPPDRGRTTRGWRVRGAL